MDILIINNHRAQGEFLKGGLQAQNYGVEVTYTEEQGLLYLCQISYHLILVKHDPPFLDALEISPKIKKLTNTPIIVITNSQDELTYLLLKERGVALVFTQPFSFTTLCKHLKLLTNKYEINNYTQLRVHDLSLDVETRTAKRQKQIFFLRNKEFALLEYLMNNAHRILTRVQILEHVWDHTTNIFTNTIDVHINILRRKIDKPFQLKLIHTIPCVGYMLSHTPPDRYR